MGIPIDPPPDYGDNCNTCFPVGETPSYVYASVAGIKPGDLFTGAESPMPNGIYVLNQIAPCEWKSTGRPAVLWRPVVGGLSVLTIVVADPGTAFTDTKAANCANRFVADWQDPVNRFHWGGLVQIMTLAGDAPLSLQDIADLLGIPIETDTKSDFWPTTDADEILASFARIQDSINILVRQDLTP